MAPNVFPIAVVINPAPAVAGAATVQASLTRMETGANRVTKAFQKLFAGAVLAQGIASFTKVLSDFDQQMATLKAVLSDTSETGEVSAYTFNQMREAAIEMGLTSRYAAVQAAEGMTILAKAGFTANETMESLPGTLTLAQAGALNLAESADIMTSVLRGFKLETRETGRVVDVLTRSANASNADVKDFAMSLKFVATIAKGTGESLEETVGALAALSNAGIKSSMAGTGLRRVLGALEGPNATQIKLLKALGLTTEDVKVSTNGLAVVLEKIGGKTNDVGKFLNMFGQRGGPAARIMDEYATKIKEYTQLNNEAEGAGQKMANFMNDSLAGAIDRARVAFTTLLIKMGDVGATSGLRTFFEGLADVIRFLARNAEGFSGALTVMSAGMLIAYGATTKFKAGLDALKFAMASNPATVWILAISTLVAAIVLFQDKLTIGSTGLGTFKDLADAVGRSIESMANRINDALGGLFGNVDFSFGAMMSGVLTMGLAIIDNFLRVLDGVAGAFRGIWRAAQVYWKLIGKTIKLELDKANTDMFGRLEKMVNGVITAYNKILEVLGKPQVGNVDMLGALGLSKEKNAALEQEIFDLGAEASTAFVDGMVWQGEHGLSAAFNTMIDEAMLAPIEDIKLKIANLQAPGKAPEPPEPPMDTNIPVDDSKGKKGKSFWEWLARKKEEIDILKLSSREYEIQNGLLSLRDELDRKLLPWEVALADAALRVLQVSKDMAQVYDDIKGPMQEVEARQFALNQVFAAGRITVKEYHEELDKVTNKALMLQNTLQSGLSAGLLQVKMDIMNVSEAASGVMTNAFGGLQDMIANFSTSGKMNISGFVDSALQDLTRLTIRMAMMKVFGGIWSGMSGGTGLIGGGGPSGSLGLPMIESAAGNDFIVGGSGGPDSQKAMMAFTPGERVTVQTPQQQKASQPQQAAPANITIVNVTDPDEIANAMQEKKGQQVILNVISRNRNTIRSSLG